MLRVVARSPLFLVANRDTAKGDLMLIADAKQTAFRSNSDFGHLGHTATRTLASRIDVGLEYRKHGVIS